MEAILRQHHWLLHARPAVGCACVLLGLAAAVCPASAAWAQFRIGVWTPGGHQDYAWSYDASFVASDANDLEALGIDLLVDSTPFWDDTDPPDHTLDFEHTIMSQWIYRGGFVVHWAPQNTSPATVLDYLEYYAGRLDAQYPVSGPRYTEVQQRVTALIAQHSPYGTAFTGYRVGHETAPTDYGIYDQGTYGNLGAVIDAIREQDTSHRIIAVGNVMDDGPTRWTTGEQAAFRNAFFRADAAPPPNILMH
ncbi:MAG: hypothetical protein AB1505_15910, partial [Candidatus Latescibacterota bacterium]